MSKKLSGIILSLGIVVVVCVASSGCLDWFAGKWDDNTYNYLFSIQPDETLYNVTLYIPIPMVKGEIPLMLIDINNHTTKPSGWICKYINTEHGRMLKISTDIITPEYHFIEIKEKVEHVINTENPVGNEPVFYPRLNETGNNFQSYIYAEYNTSQVVKCEIYMRFWASKSRGILGGTELHRYIDAIEHTSVGEIDGWYVVNGILEG